jgi:Spy/CpxP family protein refolding chaperone
MRKITAVLLTSALLAGSVGLASADTDRAQPGDGAKYGCRDKGGFGDYGHRGWGRHGHSAEARVERMTRAYGLDAKQVEQVRAITKKYEGDFDALRTKMRDNGTRLREAMDKGDAGQADVRKLADAQGKLKADMIVVRSKMRAEIDKVLTKEQLEKRKQWQDQRRKGA